MRVSALLVFLYLFLNISFSAIEAKEIIFWVERSTGTLDVINDGNAFLVEQDIVIPKGDRGLPLPDAKSWENGVIPYVISNQFSRKQKKLIHESVKLLSEKTNIQVIPRTNETNYVRVRMLNGCWSFIGVQGGAQDLSIGMGCLTEHTIIHEFLHAAGILHEQSRGDRKDYLKMFWSNIRPEKKGNFTVVRHPGFGEYDYESIMHYPSMVRDPSFVFNTNIPVFEKRNGGRIGTNKFLTKRDIETVNFIYPKAGSNKCLSLNYFDKKPFDRQLKVLLERKPLKGVCVQMKGDFKADLMPKRIEKWLAAVKETGGKVEQVMVSRSLFWNILQYLFRFITNIFEDEYKPAKFYNAKVYVDEVTKDVLHVDFLLR